MKSFVHKVFTDISLVAGRDDDLLMNKYALAAVRVYMHDVTPVRLL